MYQHSDHALVARTAVDIGSTAGVGFGSGASVSDGFLTTAIVLSVASIVFMLGGISALFVYRKNRSGSDASMSGGGVDDFSTSDNISRPFHNGVMPRCCRGSVRRFELAGVKGILLAALRRLETRAGRCSAAMFAISVCCDHHHECDRARAQTTCQ